MIGVTEYRLICLTAKVGAYPGIPNFSANWVLTQKALRVYCTTKMVFRKIKVGIKVTMSGLGQGPAQSLLRRSVNVFTEETLDDA